MEIAHELGIRQEQVSRYIRRSKSRTEIDLTEMASAYRTDQLDKLGYILSEALKAWSVNPGEDNKQNPKYLTEARGAMKDVRDLLGLNAVVETATKLDLGPVVDALEAEKARKGTDAGQE